MGDSVVSSGVLQFDKGLIAIGDILLKLFYGLDYIKKTFFIIPQSDIDLLVEFKRGTTLLGHAALIQELEELLDVKVDVVSDLGLRERIRERVLRETVAL
jgi:hypothetical protein